MPDRNFTLLESFKFAIAGFRYALETQRNLRIQLVTAILVLTVSTFLPMTLIEWVVIFLVISLVITAEILNTAIEKTIDLVKPEYDQTAKTVKDLSAAAVLFIAITSAIIGALIYLPKILPIFK